MLFLILLHFIELQYCIITNFMGNTSDKLKKIEVVRQP